MDLMIVEFNLAEYQHWQCYSIFQCFAVVQHMLSVLVVVFNSQVSTLKVIWAPRNSVLLLLERGVTLQYVRKKLQAAYVVALLIEHIIYDLGA